jgi:hypothetical protein
MILLFGYVVQGVGGEQNAHHHLDPVHNRSCPRSHSSAPLLEDEMRIPKLYKTSARDMLRRISGFKRAAVSYEDLKIRELDVQTTPPPQHEQWEVEDAA